MLFADYHARKIFSLSAFQVVMLYTQPLLNQGIPTKPVKPKIDEYLYL
jgi:hypothetical protein